MVRKSTPLSQCRYNLRQVRAYVCWQWWRQLVRRVVKWDEFFYWKILHVVLLKTRKKNLKKKLGMLTRVIYNNYEFDPPKKLGWLRRYLLVKIHTLSDPSKSFTFYVLWWEATSSIPYAHHYFLYSFFSIKPFYKKNIITSPNFMNLLINYFEIISFILLSAVLSIFLWCSFCIYSS